MDALQIIKAPIIADMDWYKEVFNSHLVHSNPLLQQVLNMVKKRTGKMMRPILTLLSAKLFGNVNISTIYTAATFEFFHTASLVHDDVIDESDERRGQASVHSVFGNKVAVLAGDYILSTAVLCSSKARDPQLVEIVSEASQTLASGEILQLYNVQNDLLSEEIYFDIIREKTAALFAACAKAGVMSVSSDELAAENLRKFGEIIGVCFQIRDDIFDYYNDEERIGKPTGNDMKEGKLTLPAIYAVNSTGNPLMRELALKVKSGDVSADEIAELVAFAKSNGGIDYARRVMNEYADKAKNLLDEYPDSAVKQALCQYVDFVVDRNL